MKKLVTYLVSLGLMISPITASTAFAADEVSATAEAAETEEKTSPAIDPQLYLFGGHVVTQSEELAFLKEPKADSAVIASIPSGVQLDIYSSDTDGWYLTLFNGQVGYVNAEYIKEITAYEEQTDITDIKKLVGNWKYKLASGNEENPVGADIGTVNVKGDGTYTFTDHNGHIATGIIELKYEEKPNGDKMPYFCFEGEDRANVGCYCAQNDPDIYYVGISGKAVLARETAAASINEIVGHWKYQIADSENDVSVSAKDIGIVTITEDGLYTFTNISGQTKNGTVTPDIEVSPEGHKLPVFLFYESENVQLSCHYDKNNPNVISVGNIGMAQLVRATSDDDVNLSEIAGQWKYQIADGNNTVSEKSRDIGTVTIKENGTYVFTDLSGKSAAGTVKIGSEEYSDGTKVPTVIFHDGINEEFSGYYDKSVPGLITLGNGGMAHLIRDTGLTAVTSATTVKVTIVTESTTAATTTTSVSESTTTASSSTTVQEKTMTDTSSSTTQTTQAKAVFSITKLCKMALADFESVTGKTASGVYAKQNSDGTITIEIDDEKGAVLETYTVDPETGKGTKSNGEAVELPQTGNNSLRTIAVASTAGVIALAGIYAITKSGVLRKKKDEE